MADWTPPEVAKSEWTPPEAAGPTPQAQRSATQYLDGVKPYNEAETRSGALRAGASAALVGAGQLIDMINPAPLVAHVLSYIGNKKINQQDKGLNPHEVASRSSAMAEVASEWAGAGVYEKLARFITDHEEGTPISAMNEEISSYVKTLGRVYQSKTNGAVQAEDVEEMANVAMLGLMTRAGNTKRGKEGARPEATPTPEAEEVLKRWAAKAEKQPDVPNEVRFPTLKKAGFVDQYGKPLAVGAGITAALASQDGSDASQAAIMGVVTGGLTIKSGLAKRLSGELTDVKSAMKGIQLHPDGIPKELYNALGAAAELRSEGLASLDQVRMAMKEKGYSPEVLAKVDKVTRTIEELREQERLARETPREAIKPESPLIQNKAARIGLAAAGGGAAAYATMSSGDTQKAMAPLGLAAILGLSAKTPLRDIHESLSHTTKVLSDLSSEMGNRSEFTREHVLQRANKPTVTKYEREMYQEIMKDRPTISGKDLVAEVKKRTGDFELTPKVTDEFANYGLEQIGRLHDEYGPNGGAAVASNKAANLPAATRIYQFPEGVEPGTNNHFQDPRYFGHTRAFEENGVRHVVEVQSDLAQKIRDPLTPVARTGLERELRQVNEDIATARTQNAHVDRGVAGPAGPNRVLLQPLQVRAAEIQAKLNATNGVSGIRPALKDWPKRLIREELADAARTRQALIAHGQAILDNAHTAAERGLNEADVRKQAEKFLQPPSTVRFATADTVAKVEGWPRPRVDTAERLRSRIEQKTNMQAVIADMRARGEEVPQKNITTLDVVQQYIDHEKSILAGLPEGDFKPEHQGIYDRHVRDIERYLKQLGGKPYTDPQGHTWIEVPLESKGKIAPTQMLGAVDKGFAGYLAAIGASATLAAYITDEDPPDKTGVVKSHRKVHNAGVAAFAAAIGGLLVLKKSTSAPIRDAVTGILRGVEDAAGNLSYQLEKISPAATRELRQYDRRLATNIHDRLQKVAPWVENFRHLSEGPTQAISAALMSGDLPGAVKLVPKNLQLEFAKGLVETLKVIEEIGKEAEALGMLKERIPNYFPRRIADYEGLMNYMGNHARSYIEKLFLAAKAEAGGKLSESEKAMIINASIRKMISGQDNIPLSPHLKNRSIKEVTADMAKFYEPAAESAISYIRSTTSSIEQARFFGRHIVQAKKTGAINLEASIGNVFAKQLATHEMSLENFQEASRLLVARFGPGEQGMGRTGRAVSGATTVALLSNPFSAAMNLQDIAGNAAVHGLMPTVKALTNILTKRPSRYTTADVGLANVIGEEFVGGASTPVTVAGRRLSMAKFVDKTMKLSGFSLLDLFGKEITLNASVISARTKLKSAKGEIEFTRSQSDYFGDDLAQLKADLRSGAKTDLTLEYAFRELADMQPISRSEMPTMAANNPKARLLWQMKSYAIKQLTLIRKRGIDEIVKGNIRQGTEFLLRYGLIVGAAGAGMDYIVRSLLGHDEKLEISDIPLQALKNFGLSQMLLEKVQSGKLKEAAALLLSPAASVVMDIAEKPEQALKYVPIVGKFLYNRQVTDTGLTRAEQQDEAKKKREKAAEKKKLERELGMKL